MKLKIGSPATGEHFFPRPKLRQRILRALNRDHVAFLGPRRTGKTSLLRSIEADPPEDVAALFLNLEKFDNVPAWINAMLTVARITLETPPQIQRFRISGKAITDILKRIEEIQILGNGIKLAQSILEQLTRQPSAGSEELDAIHARLVPDARVRATLAGELAFALDTLRHDGYLARRPDGRYRFASHILRDYWRHRTA